MPAAIDPRALRREVLRLAIPAFLALIAEPIFLLIDAAIVGHLGPQPLAGLGIASTILLTAAGLFVFLAYGTTAVVARSLGAADRARALTAGVDGIWLALLLGLAIGALMILAGGPLATAFGADAAATAQATTYVRISGIGLPGMLTTLAATGVLRGLQDTRTPLIASSLAFSANAALSFTLVHGLKMGIAGAAWGTVIAQSGLALALAIVVLGAARREQASLRFAPLGVLSAVKTGIPLLIRTLALRVTLLITTWIAAGMGDAPLAAHHVALTVWNTLAFGLDALAIAAQALTGKALGGNDIPIARTTTALLMRWGLWLGVVLGVMLFALRGFIPAAFTSDAAVTSALTAALVVVAIGQPVAGIAFVLDGVLIGAGDARWLAWAQTVFLFAYLPMALAVRFSAVSGNLGLVWLWIAFTGFMTVRAGGLWWRSRSDAWCVTGN